MVEKNSNENNVELAEVINMKLINHLYKNTRDYSQIQADKVPEGYVKT